MTWLIAHFMIAPVSKILMWLSALKFKMALLTLNAKVIAHHYSYKFVHELAAPGLRWSLF